MSWRFSLTLASRYVFSRKKAGGEGRLRLGTAIAAVALSLVPLILVLEVADGMIEGISRRYIELSSYHLQASSYSAHSREEFQKLIDMAEKISGIESVIPEKQGLGIASSPAGQTGVTVRALPADLNKTDAAFGEYLDFSAGSYSLEDRYSVLIGRRVAELLRVEPGDRIKLLTVRGGSGSPFLPRITPFTVKGVFSTGYQDLDKLWIIIPFETGLRVLPEGSSRDIIGIKTADFYGTGDQSIFGGGRPNLRRIRAAVEAAVPFEWWVRNWFELEKSRYVSFRTTKNLLVFIMSLIICVAAINIASSLVMVSIERRYEIAILMGLGSRRKQIAAAFIIMGFISGLAGTFIGLAAGLLLALRINELIAFLELLINAVLRFFSVVTAPFQGGEAASITLINPDYYLSEIPVVIRLPEIVFVAVLAVLLSTVASFFPARRASGIDPMEILQKH